MKDGTYLDYIGFRRSTMDVSLRSLAQNGVLSTSPRLPGSNAGPAPCLIGDQRMIQSFKDLQNRHLMTLPVPSR